MQPVSRSGDFRKVLYVEDEPVNVLLMRALFERIADCELVVAYSGCSAIDLARDLNPSLLMLDLRLPDVHGTDLLPLLRRIPGCERVPAVAVTAEHDVDIARTGFCELWRKPLNLMQVMQRVEALVATTALADASSSSGLDIPLLTTPTLSARVAARA